MGSWNTGTMHQITNQVVETMERRNIDICCIQETRWHGGCAMTMPGNRSKYKFFWNGDKARYGSVGVFIREKLIDHVLSIKRINHRIMSMHILLGKINIKSVYAPQSGRLTREKDWFLTKLIGEIIKVPKSKMVVVGDLNGNICKDKGFENLHGWKGYGHQNPDGTRTLDMCTTANLAITNTYFSKPDITLFTYKSGTSLSQIDFIPIKQKDLMMIRNTQIIGNEECVSQH